MIEWMMKQASGLRCEVNLRVKAIKPLNGELPNATSQEKACC